MGASAKRQRILITGRVQGVGFRPAVYRITRALGLTGFVCNDTKGVTIELQGPKNQIAEFLIRLQSGSDKPPLAEVKSCDAVDIPAVEAEEKFVIRSSDAAGTALSEVTAGRHVPRLSGRDGRRKGLSLRLSLHKLHKLRPTLFNSQDDTL